MNTIENNPRYLKALASMETAFSVVPKPKQLDSCHCCHSAAEKGVLLNTARKKLSGACLNDFIMSVFNTIGNEEDFKYFLPRVLELIALGELEVSGLVGDKLLKANYQQWPDDLSNAVDAMLRVIWQEGLLKQDDNDERSLSAYLCLVGNADVDMQPYLEDLFHVPSCAVMLWEWELEGARKGKLSDYFWSNEANKQAVIKWILSKDVEDLVMPIYLEDLNTRYAQS